MTDNLAEFEFGDETKKSVDDRKHLFGNDQTKLSMHVNKNQLNSFVNEN